MKKILLSLLICLALAGCGDPTVADPVPEPVAQPVVVTPTIVGFHIRLKQQVFIMDQHHQLENILTNL